MRMNELQLHGTKWINFSNIMGARGPEMKEIIPFTKISKIDETNVNCELPDVQDGFRKGRGTRDQIANIHWIMEKASKRFPEKHLFVPFFFFTMPKPLTMWITRNCGKF